MLALLGGLWVLNRLLPVVLVAAALLMLIEELRVDLPGQQEQAADVETRKRDHQGQFHWCFGALNPCAVRTQEELIAEDAEVAEVRREKK